jgi:hypothetical protein
MIDARELEEIRARAERVKDQRGAQGVWARHWLALYDRFIPTRSERDAYRTELQQHDVPFHP